MQKSLLGYRNISLHLWLFGCIALWSCSEAMAQRDSLWRVVKAGKRDTNEVNALLKLAQSYWYEKPDSAEIISKKATELAQKLHFARGEAYGLTGVGVSYYMRSNYLVALEYYLKALPIHEREKNQNGIAACLNNIGEIYRLQNQNNNALKYYERALELAQKNNNKPHISAITNNIAIIYHDKKDLKQSIFYYEWSLKLKRELHDEIGESTVLNNLGTIYRDQKLDSKSLAAFTQACAISHRIGDLQGEAACHNNLAHYHLRHNAPDKSLSHGLQALKLSQSLDDDGMAKEAAFTVSDTYLALKDTAHAYKYYAMGDELEDSIFTHDRERAIQELAIQYDAEQSKRDIKLLQQDNALHEAELRERNFQRNTLLGILIISFLLVLILLKNSRQKQRMMTELQSQRDKLNTLNTVKDKLFAIIGHDLRGPLASIKGFVSLLASDSLSPEQVKRMADRLNVLTASAMETLDNLLQWSISQAKGELQNITKQDLHKLIEYQFLFFKEIAAPKRISLINDIPIDTYVWADHDQLSFILRNLIANAVKFTHAFGSVKVSISYEANDMISLHVADTGVGMSAESVARLFHPDTHFSTVGTAQEKGTGLGLIVCAEFAQANGGSISVSSEEGKGSTFSVTLKSA